MNAKHAHPVRLAVYSHKGGTAKTTTAHSLACGLARQGARVLAVDLDSQACLTSWLGADPDARSLFDVVTGSATLPAVVQSTTVQAVEIIPAAGSLAGADVWLASQTGGDTWIGRQLRTLPPDRWDVFVLDCPPSVGKLVVSGLAAVDYVLSPVVPTALDSGGIVRVLDMIAELRERLPPGPQLLGVVACAVDRRRSLTRDVLAQLAELLGESLLETTVPVDVRLAEAPSYREPIFTYAPTSRSAAAYGALVEEVLKRWQSRSEE